MIVLVISPFRAATDRLQRVSALITFLILKDPKDASGRLREILVELKEIDTFVAGAPDELVGFPNAKTFPSRSVETSAGDAEPGTSTLIRAWWD